jgi:hypothetical protein
MSNFKDTVYSILNEDDYGRAQRAADEVTRQVEADRARQAEFPTREQRVGDQGPPTDTRSEQQKAQDRERHAKLAAEIKRKSAETRVKQGSEEGRREIEDDLRQSRGEEAISDDDFIDLEARRMAEKTKSDSRRAWENSEEGMQAKAAKEAARRQAKIKEAEDNAGRGSSSSGGSPSPMAQKNQERDRQGIAMMKKSAANAAAEENFRRSRDEGRDRSGDEDGSPEDRENSEEVEAMGKQAKERRLAKQAALIAAAAAAKAKNEAATAPQQESYSYNKALTFFAEQLKRKYIEEEVVNPENQPMTKSEISHRDRIRHKSPAKDARIVKSADKTQANAAYRLATYITMRTRKGKKKENK